MVNQYLLNIMHNIHNISSKIIMNLKRLFYSFALHGHKDTFNTFMIIEQKATLLLSCISVSEYNYFSF